MGQSPSSEGSEASDASDSDIRECCEEGGTNGDVSREQEGLTERVSVPSPTLRDGADAIQEPQSPSR
ncbi:hypothetical protein KUCAC02_013282 [Chaenocephalus aceratus]|nr:hypothetical protein KUCAC02_013282 [Chaenocephalus aceratus]